MNLKRNRYEKEPHVGKYPGLKKVQGETKAYSPYALQSKAQCSKATLNPKPLNRWALEEFVEATIVT